MVAGAARARAGPVTSGAFCARARQNAPLVRWRNRGWLGSMAANVASAPTVASAPAAPVGARLRAFAYDGARVAGAPPPRPPRPPRRPRRPRRAGACFWSLLGQDELGLVLAHLDDRQLGPLAGVNRSTHRASKAAMKRHLGLSDSQWQTFRAVLERRESVFITGSPGCGKSRLLAVLIERMRNRGVSASTGAAAEKIGGVTVHSLFGIPMGVISNTPPEHRTATTNDEAWGAIRKIKWEVKKKLRAYDVIVVDHVRAALLLPASPRDLA